MLQLYCVAATVAMMALVDSDAEICYEVAAEFVCEEKIQMRKRDNRKLAQKSRQARYRRRVERRDEEERLSQEAAEINAYHKQWMNYKEALKLQILEKEKQWQRYVIMRVKLKTLAKEKEEEEKMM